MKIYQGQPVTERVTDSDRNKLRESVVGDVVFESATRGGGFTDSAIEGMEGQYQRADMSLILDQLQQIQGARTSNPEELLQEVIGDFLRNQRWKNYQGGDCDEDWEKFFSLLNQGIDMVSKVAVTKDQEASGKEGKLADLAHQNKEQLMKIKEQEMVINEL